MRPLLSLTIAVVVLGGLRWYMQVRDRFRVHDISSGESVAAGVFSVELTLTFNAGPDPFGLDRDNATAVEVMFRGQPLLRETGTVEAGTPLVVSPVQGVVEGPNEFFVSATPLDENTGLAHALRVRILRDGVPIAEQTLWSAPGQPVRGPVAVSVAREPNESTETHGHEQ